MKGLGYPVRTALASRVLSTLTATALCLAMYGSMACALENRFIAETRNLEVIKTALEKEKPVKPLPTSVTGITLPHHLLAADLIARGVWSASAGHYKRVLILSPDHFRTLSTPFGVTTQGFDEVTGYLAPATELSRALLAASPLFSDTGAAAGEHGVRSVTPFVRAVFPNVEVTAITVSTSPSRAELDKAVELLRGLVGPETLIVQSTDFSHHLPVMLAAQRDQESLAAIATGEADVAARLLHGAHLDSRGSLYIQMRLQAEIHDAKPVVIGNRNSNEYGGGSAGTTSYVVAAFLKHTGEGWRLQHDDYKTMYHGGDVLAGRGFAKLIEKAAIRDMLVKEIRAVTGGMPLIVNLEGVALDEFPAGGSPVQHFMLAQSAMPFLAELGVVAANIANNHAYDFGDLGASETARILRVHGIGPLEHNVLADLGPFRVLPLSFKRSYFAAHAVIRSPHQLRPICELSAKAPLIVLPHWGTEYTSQPSPEENEYTDMMVNCGVSAIIGNHSHRASTNVESLAGGLSQRVYSMGNLVFDQKGERVSSAIVEVRVFRQGTVILRLIPLPNLYEKALEQLERE
jgi:AmmeMemoRadiSam system protein B